MDNNDITTVTGLVEFLKREGELLVTTKEVDPVCEVTGVAKAFEDGPAVLFENVKGFPNQRLLINVSARKERLAKIFNVPDAKELKFKCLEAIKNPIPPKVVDKAPCQEVVITKDIDVLKTMPVTQSIETDPGKIISGGISLISSPEIGHCVSYRRTFFRGKDWASLAIIPPSHVGKLLPSLREKNEKLPLTLNIGCPPAVMTVAARTSMYHAIPTGTDELAIAGRLQDAPVEICKAKTIDAYAIANAEWVIEGYVDPSQLVWESAEAEKTGDEWQPFFIEWTGYQGWAGRVPRFQVTAITHRKNNPIFYPCVASSLENFNMAGSFTEAILYDLGNCMSSGLVKDVNVLDSMHANMGVVIQLRKRSSADDGFVRNMILAALGTSKVQMVVVVDEDINIYSAEDVIWALTTRVNPKKDVIAFDTGEIINAADAEAPRRQQAGSMGRIGFDATYSFDSKFLNERRRHPLVNLEKWFTKEEIRNARALQSEYAKFLAESRF
ncbi:UbiD family decarboxylase domain-containing protein [Chloroflexota bacterium]